RNMIGAVVGVQPFGGRGLSGTGPKAGGPDYVKRLMKETTAPTNSQKTAKQNDEVSFLDADKASALDAVFFSDITAGIRE
ncbi:MAG: hypothetical protein VW874_01890, partial [Gammaproteobacteria bacterium]